MCPCRTDARRPLPHDRRPSAPPGDGWRPCGRARRIPRGGASDARAFPNGATSSPAPPDAERVLTARRPLGRRDGAMSSDVLARIERQSHAVTDSHDLLSVDGVYQGPRRPERGPQRRFRARWLAGPHIDEATGQFVDSVMERADAFLLGRRTYDPRLRRPFPDPVRRTSGPCRRRRLERRASLRRAADRPDQGGVTMRGRGRDRTAHSTGRNAVGSSSCRRMQNSWKSNIGTTPGTFANGSARTT